MMKTGKKVYLGAELAMNECIIIPNGKVIIYIIMSSKFLLEPECNKLLCLVQYL